MSAVTRMRTPAEAALIERFAAEKATLPGAAEARAAAFARFETAGLPSKRVESYHYTDVRALMRTVAPDFAGKADGMRQPETDEPRISFFNGVLHSVSNLPPGVSCEALASALASGTARLGVAMGQASDAVVDLNTAFAREGVAIRVAAGITVPGILHISLTDAMAAAMPISSRPRVIVEVGAGASLCLMESITGSDGIAYQVNSVVELLVGDGAKVEHIRVNLAGDKALVLSTLAATLGAESELMSLNFTSGGEVSRHQSFITYAGENAKLRLNGVTMLNARQHCDNTLVVDHAVPHGESRELFRAAIDGEAQGVFQGKIIVRPHAQKTDGQMASNALLLSDDAAMSNKPELEIFADDVVCAHGATCGALDENQLFYLMARGLPRAEAEALLVEAFLDEALDAVSHEGLREALAAKVSVWLSSRKTAA
ncbi:MAG: Fe-S cluster assembly protein [Beijerinckiaceae bacterium]|nr:MAG: Fe-S cluster assembly protein [Beijerinckiaceae bacterium]